MKEFFKLLRNARFRRTMWLLFTFAWQFWKLGRQKKVLSNKAYKAKSKAMYKKQAKKFADTAVDMGGLIIKLGQHISSRIDILPKEFTDELSKLQDSVDPVDTVEIRKAIEKELGQPVDKLFAEFDGTAIAAASLGQVHRARLLDGEEVAVKVMRPGIEDIIEVDLKSLQIAIKFLKKRTKIGNYMDLDMVYQEFNDTINDELDFRKEGQNAESFQMMFIDRDDVIVPMIHWGYSAKKVLTMEFMDGVKISDIKQLNKWKVDKKQIAESLFDIYVRQVLVDGLFHADPHPGNVLVQKDGTIVLLDYGMVGRLTEDMKKQMVALIMAIFLKDGNGVVDSLVDLAFLRKNADLDVLRRNLNLLFEQFDGADTKLSFLDDEDAMDELREFINENPFQLPANTTFLGKALFTIYGLCNALDKNFDVVEKAKPYAEEFVGGDLTGNILDTILDQGKDILKSLIPTTKKIISVVDKMESGKLTVKVHKSFENRLIDNQNRNTSRIVKALIGVMFIWSGFQVYGTADDRVVYVMWAIGVLTMLLQARNPKVKTKRRGHGSRGNRKKPKFHP